MLCKVILYCGEAQFSFLSSSARSWICWGSVQIVEDKRITQIIIVLFKTIYMEDKKSAKVLFSRQKLLLALIWWLLANFIY